MPSGVCPDRTKCEPMDAEGHGLCCPVAGSAEPRLKELKVPKTSKTEKKEVIMIEQNGKLTGSGTWSNGARSNFTGEVKNGEVVLYRVDSGGLRGTFWGKVTAGRRMEGTDQNDSSSPGGNSSSYSWTAVRLP